MLIVPFGKHKGKLLSELPASYVLFLAGWRLRFEKREALQTDASQWVKQKFPKIHTEARMFLKQRCYKCLKPLTKIGTERANGLKTHGDWKNRYLHKKCYGALWHWHQRAEGYTVA